MKFNPKQYAKNLLQLAENSTKKEIPALVDEFMNFLTKERKLTHINQIVKNLENLILAEEGKSKMVIESSQKLDEASKKAVLNFLRKEESEVEILQKEDKKFLGGVRIRLNDLLLDATLSGQLEKLRQELS